jgi:putative transposase
MTDYLDNRVPGASIFFTVRLLERGSTLLTDHMSAFGEAMRLARARKPFHVDAWAVMPDHAHAIWTLPPGDHDSASRWRAIKIAFSKALRKAAVPDAHDGAIWQRHYQQYRVGNAHDYAALVDYTHFDAVRHGYCSQPCDWPWSSLHRFVSAGHALPTAPHLIVPPWVQRPQSRGLDRF